MYPYFVSITSICTYLEGAWSSTNVISMPLKWIEEWIKKPYLVNGGHAVPDIKEKQPRLLTASLVEPMQSGSQAHVQYCNTGSHVTLYTVFLHRYRRLDTLVIMYSWYQ